MNHDVVRVPAKAVVGEILPAFCLDRFMTTNRRFDQFVAAGGYDNPNFWSPVGFAWAKSNGIDRPAYADDSDFNRPEQPVTGISEHEAEAFARFSGGRLPTAREWERAASAENGPTRYPWGDAEPDETRALFAPDFQPIRRGTVSVYRLPAGDSPVGARQLAGNLHEWTGDAHSGDVAVDAVSALQIVKGGAWTTGPAFLETASRWAFPADLRDNVVGMRVAYDPEVRGDA